MTENVTPTNIDRKGESALNNHIESIQIIHSSSLPKSLKKNVSKSTEKLKIQKSTDEERYKNSELMS